MTDQPMDAFDTRLTNLMTAYGDRAVTAYDATAIARVATARHPWATLRLGRVGRAGRGARLLLLAAAVGLLALAASLAAGAPRPASLQTTIVLGPAGPEQTAYRVPAGPPFELRIENRSDITWVPWGGFTEKDGWCRLVSGAPVPGDPCAVAPRSTIVLTPPGIATGPTEIYLAPMGVDWHGGIRVTVDVVAEP